MMKVNVSMFKDNMLLSLCFPPRVEHGGGWRLKPGVQKCKCVQLDSSQHTLSTEMESPSTQQEVTSVHSNPTGNEDDG